MPIGEIRELILLLTHLTVENVHEENYLNETYLHETLKRHAYRGCSPVCTSESGMFRWISNILCSLGRLVFRTTIKVWYAKLYNDDIKDIKSSAKN